MYVGYRITGNFHMEQFFVYFIRSLEIQTELTCEYYVPALLSIFVNLLTFCGSQLGIVESVEAAVRATASL